MKKRLLVLVMTMLFAASTLVGCTSESKEKTASGNSSTQENSATGDAQAEESQEANPWKESSEEEILEKLNAGIFVPDDAKNAKFSINEKEKMAQLKFELNGVDCTYRFKVSDKFEDISGCNYDWNKEEDFKFGGYPAISKSYKGDKESVDLILWSIEEAGYVFSFSASAPDLAGFDINEVAGSYIWDIGISDDEPNDFLQIQSERTEFKNYDEVISCLKKGQGYAYAELEGYDGKALIVSEKLSDDGSGNMVSNDASIYCEWNGKAEQVGLVDSISTNNPLLYGNGMICAISTEGNDYFEANTINSSNHQLLHKAYIYYSDYPGDEGYQGVHSDNGEQPKDFSSSDEAKQYLDKLLKENKDNKPLVFTVVK